MYWYFVLFIVAFTAASILPGSPDAVLAIMIANKKSVVLCICVATFGSYLGACFNYYLGLGSCKIEYLNKFRPSEEKREQSLLRYQKYGRISLFFSWFPFVGDALTFLAGYLKLDFTEFTIWVISGRAVKIAVVVYLATFL